MSDASDRWSRIQTLFEQARERPADERTAWLRSVCGDDPEVYDNVAAMLKGEADEHAIFGGRALDVLGDDGLADVELAPSRAGERVGPWVLGERVGAGGMGAVYRAERDDEFEQTAAIKRIKLGMDSEAVLARFRAERQILARLEHTGIARLLDGGLDAEGRPYFAMEYVDGEPITDYADARQLDVDARLALFERVCEPVAYAHRQLVVHRDLKPSNVLVADDGTGEPQVKLLDFGIARVLSDDSGDELTRTGQRLFTPGYAAPEQVRGEAPSASTDVYALGALLYRLVSGARPIATDDRTPAEIELAVLNETPPRPSASVTDEAARARGTTADALAKRLAGDLDTICLTALREEPEHRYGSAAELLADVRRHRQGFPIEARPATARYRAGLFVKRHRAGVAAAAVALAAVAGGAGVALWQAAEARAERDRAETEATTAEEVTAFVSSLLSSASVDGDVNADATRVRELRVVDMLDGGVERIEAELAEQPSVQVRLLDVIGKAYRSLGDYDRAAPVLERSYALSADPALDPDLRARAAASLADLRRHTNDLEGAEALLHEGLAILRTHGDPAGLEAAAILSDLGNVKRYQGDYEAVVPLLNESLAIYQETLGDDHPYSRDLRLGLGYAYWSLGDIDVAERVLRDELARLRVAFPDGHTATAATTSSLGSLLQEDRGDPAAAEPFLRESLALNRRIRGDEHPDVAVSLNNLARNQLLRGQTAEAIELFREALALRRRVLGPDHRFVAYSLVGLGRAQLDAGRADVAEGHFREAVAIREAAYAADHDLIAETRSWLGASLVAQGRRGAGRAMLRRAYEDLLAKLGPDARKTREARERLDA